MVIQMDRFEQKIIDIIDAHAEQIKELRLPCDPTDDCPFEADVDYGSLDEDSSAISDIDFLSDDDYDYYEFSGGSDFSEYDDDHPDYYDHF